MTKYV
jgi:hypothetical protein